MERLNLIWNHPLEKKKISKTPRKRIKKRDFPNLGVGLLAYYMP
jgi:hypothetical protein